MADDLSKEEVLSEQGIYLLLNDITYDSVRPVMEGILVAHLEDKPPKDIRILISSWGGSLNAAFALVDVMAGSEIPITTVGLGAVGSSALVILIAGKYRILTPTACVLSHQYSDSTVGKHHDLVAAKRGLDITHEQMLNYYVRCTGLSAPEIEKHLLSPSDTYLRPEEALAYNLCDEVRDYNPRTGVTKVTKRENGGKKAVAKKGVRRR